jgi:hypothetical protein
LKAAPDNNGLSSIFVTDYSERFDLHRYPNQEWASSLDGRVLRIDLWDGQIQMAKSVQSGLFYSIQKLRLRKDLTKMMIGRLGGPERLINLLNPITNKENLAPLLE